MKSIQVATTRKTSLYVVTCASGWLVFQSHTMPMSGDVVPMWLFRVDGKALSNIQAKMERLKNELRISDL